MIDRLCSMRLPLNVVELKLDSAAVITTKLISPAALGMPSLANVLTNGLPCVPSSFHG